MKKITFIILLVLGAYAAKSQTIDTAYHSFPSCKTVAFYNNARIDTISTPRVAQVARIEITEVDVQFGAKTMVVRYAFTADDGTAITGGDCILTAIEYGTFLTAARNNFALIFSLIGAKLNIIYQ